MNTDYADPNKWDQLPDYELEQDDEFGQSDSGNGRAYTGQRTSQEPWVRPPRDIDDLDVALGWATKKELIDIESAQHNVISVGHIERVEFRWSWHRTGEGTHRSQLRYGTMTARGTDFVLWGMSSWQEFRDHIAPDDFAWAREYWEQLKVALATAPMGRYKKCFWAGRGYHHSQIEGFWAMTIDDEEQRERSLIIWANGKETRRQVGWQKQNTTLLRKEP